MAGKNKLSRLRNFQPGFNDLSASVASRFVFEEKYCPGTLIPSAASANMNIFMPQLQHD